MQIHWKFVKCKLVDVCKMVSNVDVSKTLTFHNLILRERKMHKICWTRFERISTQNLKNVMNLVFSRTVRKIHSGHRPDRSVTFICTPKYVFTILWPKSPAFWWSGRVDQPMFPTLPMEITKSAIFTGNFEPILQ